MNKIFISLILVLSSLSFSAITNAEKTVVLEEVPSPPNTLESGYEYEPEITIRKEGTKRIEEHRINGNLYYIKVTPEGFPPYYLVRETEGGDWIRQDDLKPLVVPQWVLFSW
ncbi:DUF2782 domain-containing protein [Methylophilaceae bacterium]|jgi:hypothetical protein|nr:DUF2782 domain-containing protein [Nitrosomonadales bacterium]MDA9086272.1 DUF2782 domain-containing protein [Methylophilaceae bacterium]|tara:strand:- start:1966 stop:2301 length:336 start_codon:yes stop_codon:yes gene_type:complete